MSVGTLSVMTLSRWTAKRLFVATAVVFAAGLVVFYSQGLFANLPVEQAGPVFMTMGLTARVLLGLAVLLGVLGAVRKAQDG